MATVRPADQAQINEFGRNQTRIEELAVERDLLKERVNDLDDVEAEVLLNEDAGDGTYRLRIGDAFFHVEQDVFEEFVEGKQSAETAELERVQVELSGASDRQAELKSSLYSRFGDSIQLEK